MGLINVLKLANNIEGTYVEVGFGKGVTARKAFNKMNEGVITKRQSWLIDSFKGTGTPTSSDLVFSPGISEGYEPGRYQVAMDMRYDLTNPSEDVFVLQSFATDSLSTKYYGGTIACLHIDLPTYSGVVATLEALHPKLNLNAVVYIGGYDYSFGIRRAVDDYLKQNKVKYQLETLSQDTYLINKVAPVKFVPPGNIKNYFLPEDTIPVSRPTVVPFADRYIKPVIEKFRPKSDIIQRAVTKLLPDAFKDTEFKPEEGIEVSRTKVTPFEDRYEKREPAPFKPKKVIKEGLNVIDKKVTR